MSPFTSTPAPLPARRAARRKILAGFAAAFALLAMFTFLAHRASVRLVDDARAGAGPDKIVEDANRYDTVLLIATVSRGTVIALAMVALLWDMSKREKAEAALLRSRDEALEAAEGRRVAQAQAERLGEKLATVLRHVDVGVVVVETDGSFSLYNAAAERINGAWRDEIERLSRAGGHPLLQEDEKTVIPSGDDPLGRALRGEIVRNARVFWRTPFRPKGYHLDLSAVALRDPRGMPNGVVMMFTERAPG